MCEGWRLHPAAGPADSPQKHFIIVFGGRPCQVSLTSPPPGSLTQPPLMADYPPPPGRGVLMETRWSSNTVAASPADINHYSERPTRLDSAGEHSHILTNQVNNLKGPFAPCWFGG